MSTQSDDSRVASSEPSLTEALARYWSTARYEDLPAPLELEHLLRKDEAVAVPAIGKKQVDALGKAVLSLETCADFGEVITLLRPEVNRTC
jgi:hypothetical protein